MRTPGKLFGRSTSLWLGLVLAVINALILLHVIELDATQIAALNTLAIALLAVLANEENPTTAGTLSATTQAPIVQITKLAPPPPETTIEGGGNG